MLEFHLERLRQSAEAYGLSEALQREGRDRIRRRTKALIARAMEAFVAGTREGQARGSASEQGLRYDAVDGASLREPPFSPSIDESRKPSCCSRLNPLQPA